MINDLDCIDWSSMGTLTGRPRYIELFGAPLEKMVLLVTRIPYFLLRSVLGASIVPPGQVVISMLAWSNTAVAFPR
ncbi:hypothetical protein [Streptomyces sp. NPDC050121]|uniref:hypothetical protein n=1 Tax=Streptomyces sp. NPDC050121 TaxID=3365601 RepID=UPI0037958819